MSESRNWNVILLTCGCCFIRVSQVICFKVALTADISQRNYIPSYVDFDSSKLDSVYARLAENRVKNAIPDPYQIDSNLDISYKQDSRCTHLDRPEKLDSTLAQPFHLDADKNESEMPRESLVLHTRPESPTHPVLSSKPISQIPKSSPSISSSQPLASQVVQSIPPVQALESNTIEKIDAAIESKELEHVMTTKNPPIDEESGMAALKLKREQDRIREQLEREKAAREKVELERREKAEEIKQQELKRLEEERLEKVRLEKEMELERRKKLEEERQDKQMVALDKLEQDPTLQKYMEMAKERLGKVSELI